MNPKARAFLFLLAGLLAGPALRAADVAVTRAMPPAKALADALAPEQWQRVQESVDRALAWLASQQVADGSFPSLDVGQPGVTSLGVMAFLSRGHQPGFGPYGKQLDRAIDYVLSCQQADGLICHETPGPVFEGMTASHTATYNHFISGLMLGEVYGHVTGRRAKQVRAAIGKALTYARALQTRQKPWASDAGGVRYLRYKEGEGDSDLSTTAWYLMFLRSAKNAEFNVPKNYVDDAVGYVRGCWNPQQQMFNYMADGHGGQTPTRGMVGAGILTLSLAGEHNTPIALAAGDWLVAHPFEAVDQTIGGFDRYFYSTYYCSQAAAQLGGQYWEKIFPNIVGVALKTQSADGSFPPEQQWQDGAFGSAYTTAMAVLALTPAYQLLPVYQR